jgi:hypothetical protein
MADVVNINDVLDHHVVLDLECLDRIYRAPRSADSPSGMRDPPTIAAAIV